MKQFNCERGTKYDYLRKARCGSAYYGGMSPRIFVNKDSLDYEKPYANTYSARQLDIISGKIDSATVRLCDLRQLIYKADKLGDIELAGRMEDIYNRRKNPDMYEPNISYDKALELLSQLGDEE